MSDALYELQVHSVPSVYTFMYMCAYLVKFRILSGTGTGTVCAYVRTYMYLICTHIWDAIACTQHTDVVVTVISLPVCLQSLGQLSICIIGHQS